MIDAVPGKDELLGDDFVDHLEKIALSRLYFVHHSVGRDLLAGLARFYRHTGHDEPKLISLDEAKKTPGAWFAHDFGGSNTRPKTKIDFFAKKLSEVKTLEINLAFMKLCFVDFNPSTDTAELFAYYKKVLDRLRNGDPGIKIAHCTVPLTEYPRGVKERLYRFIGREIWADASNARRHEFNQRLLEGYRGDPIFDIASFESTGPDGRRALFNLSGKTFPCVDSRYTDDGGHLNALGQQVLGRELALFLSRTLSSAS